jgi:glutathione S-transferase
MVPTLYRLEGCPFCELIVDEMDELGLKYESVWVEGIHSKRDEVKKVSGQRQVPVLVDDDLGLTMHQSGRIMEHLKQTYRGENVDPGSVEPSF